MIVVKTPLRIGFAGGGTDLPAHYVYRRGAVINAAISLYVNIFVNRRFEPSVRVSYSQTEIVNDLHIIQHDLVRETLKDMNIMNHVEIVSMADIPGRGSGLGSSSSFTVGLAHALDQYRRLYRGYDPGNLPSYTKWLAEYACNVEMKLCAKPVGKQDQYAAAYGGINYLEFLPTGEVKRTEIRLPRHLQQELLSHLLLVYTGNTRSADKILTSQTGALLSDEDKKEQSEEMRKLADRLYEDLRNEDISTIGSFIREGWELKRGMADGITNEHIDELYDTAIEAGAEAGKIMGAGGGGFMLFYVPPKKRSDVLRALQLPEVKFGFVHQGSRVVYMEGFTNA